MPAASVVLYLVLYLPNRESEGLNEFVHRALATGPLTISSLWLDNTLASEVWLNRSLVIGGLAALVIAALLAGPRRGERVALDTYST
jgi:hypothetical protein